MSGVRLQVSFDDAELQRALDRLQRAGANLEPYFRDLGEALLFSHEQRWADEEAPDGTPWAPLSDDYARRKARTNPSAGILTLDEHLRRLVYQASGSGLELGTNRIYGATHQLGDESRGIPARPFLGLSAADEVMVVEMLREHLEQAMS